jgi:hypothetical protein
MKILKNKYFILGNIALLLAAIPLTLLFISRQQDVRSRAAPTTRITFAPTTLTFEGEQCTEQSIAVNLDPGDNIVSTVELFLTYDATKFNISIAPNENVFPPPNGILRGPTISNGQASVVMTIGSNVTNAIQAPVDIATITVVPISSTDEGPANISIDSSKTRVFSLSDTDADTENVFLSGGQAAISVNASCIEGSSEEEPSPTPTPTGGIGGGGSLTPTATPSASPTTGANQSPVCSTITTSPSNSGNAPFVMTLSAQGTDSDGTISKATFNFGDNTIQDVLEGLGTAAVTTQLAHTYQTVGSYSASVVFTDNGGAVSSSCTTTITVLSGTSTPTPTASGSAGIQPTATATPTPTIENPGGIGTTIAVIGGLLLVILGGLALIAL